MMVSESREREAKADARAELMMLSERERAEKLEAQMEQIASKGKEEVISESQVLALGSRLEALHAAGLLTDAESNSLEDLVADFIDVRSTFGAATLDVVRSNPAADKTKRLVALSESMPKDAAFARQARRKFAGRQ